MIFRYIISQPVVIGHFSVLYEDSKIEYSKISLLCDCGGPLYTRTKEKERSLKIQYAYIVVKYMSFNKSAYA